MKHISLIGNSFPAFRNLPERGIVDFKVVESEKTAQDQLFDVVYGVDPFTRFPQSDVALYLSDKVDPMIREFIAANLLTPNSSVPGVPDDQADILFDLVRHDGESISDYAVRVRSIIDSDNDVRLKSQVVESKED